VAASFVADMGDQESMLDLMFVAEEAHIFTSGRGLGNVDRIFEILAGVVPSTELTFDVLKKTTLERAALLSSCLCVFVDWDEERREFVKDLLALGLPVMVFVITGEGANVEPGPEGAGAAGFHVLTHGEVEGGLAAI
jgi:hypothetical protein